MSFDTTISTTLRLSGVEAYLAGLQQARAATEQMSNLKGTVNIDDANAKAKLQGVQQEVAKVGQANANAKVSVTGAEEAATGLGKVNAQISQLRDIGYLTAELAAVGLGLEKIAEPAAVVEQNLKDVQILAKATDDQIKGLKSASLTFADMGTGAGKATEAMVELSRAGVEVSDTARIARDAVALATAGQVEQGVAANALTNTLHAFNLGMDQSTRVANLYAGAADVSSATTADLISSMAQAGQAAQSMGQSVDDTLSVLALFADRGLKGSDAGTSLRTMLLRLVPTSQQAKDDMAALGLSFTDAHGKIIPLAQVAEQLQTKLAGLSEAQRTNALQTIFGTDAFRAANILYQSGAQGVDKYKAAVGNISAESIATQRTQTLEGAVSKLGAQWENLRVVYGTAMLPALTGVANLLGAVANIAQHAPAPLIQVTAELIALAAAMKTVSIAGNLLSVLGSGGSTLLGDSFRTLIGRGTSAQAAAETEATAATSADNAAKSEQTGILATLSAALEANTAAILANTEARAAQIASTAEADAVLAEGAGAAEAAAAATDADTASLLANADAAAAQAVAQARVNAIYAERAGLAGEAAVATSAAGAAAAKGGGFFAGGIGAAAADIAVPVIISVIVKQVAIDPIFKAIDDAISAKLVSGSADTKLGKDAVQALLSIDDPAVFKDQAAQFVKQLQDQLEAEMKNQASEHAGAGGKVKDLFGLNVGVDDYWQQQIETTKAAIKQIQEMTTESPPVVGSWATAQNPAIDLEDIKAKAADAQQSIQAVAMGFDAVQKAAAKVDVSKGLSGVKPAIPELQQAHDLLATMGIKDDAVERLLDMGRAISELDAELSKASQAFDGFQAQFSATDQSISKVDAFRKQVDEVYKSAKQAQSAGVATPEQIELIDKYKGIVGNLDGLVQGLRAHQAGDILNMAKNYPDLIAYDNRLRDLVAKYGGPQGIQIELQLELDEAKTEQKVNAVVAGIANKASPLYQAVTVAVKGNADAEVALNKLRGTVDGIPTEKEIKALATVLGLDSVEQLAAFIANLPNYKAISVDVTTRSTTSTPLGPSPYGPGGFGDYHPTDPARGYASGGSVYGDLAIVGDRPGGGILNTSEVVDFNKRRVYSNSEARSMGLFGQGLQQFAGPPGPVGTIDLTQPGIVAQTYGGPGTGIADPSGGKAAAGVKAVGDAAAVTQSKLIDASNAAREFEGSLSRLSPDEVNAVAKAFQSVYDYAKAANEAAIPAVPKGGKADPNATIGADNAAAEQAVNYATAFAQALADARNPATDLTADFAKLREYGGPIADSAIRWLSVQREINITQQNIADTQQTITDLEKAHTAQVAQTNVEVESLQMGLAAEQKAEQAAATARDRQHTIDSYNRSQAQTQAQRRFDDETARRTAYEQALQRQWAAEATQAQLEKATRDRAWSERQRQLADLATAENATYTVEQRADADKQTALQRYGTAALQQLQEQKTALDLLHTTQMGMLGAQSQLLTAQTQASTDSGSRLALSVQLAANRQFSDDVDARYKMAIDANQAAQNAEQKRSATALADLQDETTAETRAHEDRLSHIAAVTEAETRAHDDAEIRIAAEQTALATSHSLYLQQLQDEDARRAAAHAKDLQRQQDKDAADALSYQKQTWQIDDENKRKTDGYNDAIKKLQETQKTNDATYERQKGQLDDVLKKEQTRLTALQGQQQYLDNVMGLWNELYKVAGATANQILTVLQGQAPVGLQQNPSAPTASSVTGHAAGAVDASGLMKIGERGWEYVIANSPVNVIPHVQSEAMQQAAKAATGTAIGQIGPFYASAGETWPEFSSKVMNVIRPWWQEHSPEGVAANMGIR